jgi:hypothetical protein
MASKKTISTRWRDWDIQDPLWARICLTCFMLVMIGLGVHLAVHHGPIRQGGLVLLIVADSLAILITAFRKQWYWFGFFIYMTIGVIVFELVSYFT